MERRIVVIQARRASTRLPDKVLLDLAGHPVLAHVVARCRAIPGIAGVVCAIPDSPGHDPLAAVAAAAGAGVFAGSEQDVLARYRGAAEQAGADTVLRVTSDCPLIDPGLCGDVLDLRAGAGVDYACNNQPPGFPHGLDCEAFTLEALRRADAAADRPEQREHVTPWLRTTPEVRRANLPGPGGAMVAERWTLDFPEDLAFLRAVADLLPPLPVIPDWRSVLRLLDSRPDLRALNAARRDPARQAPPA